MRFSSLLSLQIREQYLCRLCLGLNPTPQVAQSCTCAALAARCSLVSLGICPFYQVRQGTGLLGLPINLSRYWTSSTTTRFVRSPVLAVVTARSDRIVPGQ